METFLFTSESVNEGHPDKLCDQVSDAVLDACLAQDPDSKVACETCTKTNMVMVFGEITTKANVDYEKIVRDTCRSIGFTSADVGLDADHCKVLVNIEQQSPDIAQGVHGHLTKRPEEIGAGDQGHMFGYATDETPELMPLSHVLATKLGAKLTEVRKNGTCPWLRPDGKTQVTVEYYNENGAMVPVRVHTVLISTQHDETVTNDEIAADLKQHVIKPVIPDKYLDDKTIFHLNPSGRFVIGGPHGDAGLTGRKIIIDTYGGWGAHGGGAFSGKDPTKVDRSGAYIVRQAAKSIVASGLARRCIVQVSYAIGVPEPLSVFVDSYGTGKIPDKEILKIVKENFDFRPGMISINLDLKRGGNGRFLKTAAYGHFGRDDPDFTWEIVKPLKGSKRSGGGSANDDGDSDNMRGHKLENGHSNVSNVEIEKSRVTGIANGKENTSSNIGAFDASKLQKLRNKGSKKTDTVVSKGSKPDPKKKTTKKNRVWDDSPPESKLDFTDPAEVFSSDSESEEDEEVGKHNKPDAKKTGWFSSMFHSIAGKANLDKADLEPALKSLKNRLMTKNVAEEIVEKLCESVAASLEGKKLASFTMISSIVQVFDF
ncbi:hypothetical protein WN944_025250 [Citrus x changshan-huyou]|uniref:S-adenosylmethionine synthase n=2 Tax=Citrus TaxID=2706 RepID=A0AAP0LPJ4_9ROSI